MLLLLIPLSLPAAWLSLGLFFAPAGAGGEETRADRGHARELPPAAGQLVAHFGVDGRAGRRADADVAAGRDHGRRRCRDGRRLGHEASVGTLAIPLGIVCGAIIVPWCGALVLAMLGDLMVRQEEGSPR